MACALGLWFLSAPTVSATSISAQEPQLRAAVILGIVRFTSWPRNSAEKKPLAVCTAGRPAAEPALLPINEPRKLAGKTIVVRPLRDDQDKISSCDVIVFGPDIETTAYTRSLKRAAALPILTICDACEFVKFKTIVRLIRRQNRIGFEIDIATAKSRGIVFSSSLLELASEVRR